MCSAGQVLQLRSLMRVVNALTERASIVRCRGPVVSGAVDAGPGYAAAAAMRDGCGREARG